MIRKNSEFVREIRSKMRGGEGDIQIEQIWKPAEEMKSNTRMYAKLTIQPGDSIGYHVHENEEELFYILFGTAELNDNGTIQTLHAGESSITRGGEGHSVRNIGSSPLEILAMIGKYC